MRFAEKEIRGVKKDLLFFASALIVLGLLLILFPGTSAVIVCRVAGGALCLWGLLRVAAYFAATKGVVLGSFGLVQGVALIAFGVFFLVKPQAVAVFVTVAMAILIMVDGVLKLQFAVDFARLKARVWWAELVGAVVMIALGAVALFHPFKAASSLMIFVGITFVAEGVWDLVSVLWLSSAADKVKRALQSAAENARTEASAVDAESAAADDGKENP